MWQNELQNYRGCRAGKAKKKENIAQMEYKKKTGEKRTARKLRKVLNKWNNLQKLKWQTTNSSWATTKTTGSNMNNNLEYCTFTYVDTFPAANAADADATEPESKATEAETELNGKKLLEKCERSARGEKCDMKSQETIKC